jgi:hypothetical protein
MFLTKMLIFLQYVKGELKKKKTKRIYSLSIPIIPIYTFHFLKTEIYIYLFT